MFDIFLSMSLKLVAPVFGPLVIKDNNEDKGSLYYGIGLFKTLSNIYDGAFLRKLLLLTNFAKKKKKIRDKCLKRS